MLESAKNMGQDTSEPERATNAIPALDHSQPIQEAEQMTRLGQYNPIGVILNREHSNNTNPVLA